MQKRMFALALAVSLAFPAVCAGAAEHSPQASAGKLTKEDMRTLQEGVQGAFTDLVNVMGSAAAGISRGMRDGALSVQAELDGMDGSAVVTTAEQLQKLARVTAVCSRKGTDWHLTVSFRNEGDVRLRLSGLNRTGQLMLLDAEGFVHLPAGETGRTLDVPARAAVRRVFVFPDMGTSAPAVFRLFGADIAVRNAAPAEASDADAGTAAPEAGAREEPSGAALGAQLPSGEETASGGVSAL